MVEPLLHFAVPFASLRAVGVDLRKVTFVSLVALTPDLDALFQVHRSQSHSVIVLALVAFPLLILTRNRKTLRSFVLLGTFGVLVHLVLDLFQAPTPVLWPLVSQSLWIQATVNFHMGSAPVITGSAALQTEPTAFEHFTSFDAPVLTAPGLGVAIVLMALPLVQILRNRLSVPSVSQP